MSLENCCATDDKTRKREHSGRRCKHFNTACPDCLCENHSIGIGSPGIVRTSESLIRFHFSPMDLDDDGRPTTAAFSDVDSVGLSTTRDQATDEVMEAAIAGRLNAMRTSAEWHSVSIALVSDIRGIFVDQENNNLKQAFCVYDTAEPENVEHAEVMATKTSRRTRQELRSKFLAVGRCSYRSDLLQPIRSSEPSSSDEDLK